MNDLTLVMVIFAVAIIINIGVWQIFKSRKGKYLDKDDYPVQMNVKEFEQNYLTKEEMRAAKIRKMFPPTKKKLFLNRHGKTKTYG